MHTKTSLSWDKRAGQWVRNLGRHLGKHVQFRLGKDRQEANLRKTRLEALYARLEASGLTWEGYSLPLARAVAAGQTVYRVPSGGEWTGEAYLHLVERLRLLADGIVQVVPDDAPEHKAAGLEAIAAQQEAVRQARVAYPIFPDRPTYDPSQTLHLALAEYVTYLKAKSADNSGWGRVKVKQATALYRHPDMPLGLLDLDKMEEMLRFWAARPQVKDRDKPISALTARNQIRQLKDFFKWLHYSKWAWKRPDGFDDIKVKIASSRADNLKHLNVQTYTLEQLQVLYGLASETVRLFLLLGLNCGFSIAEIGSLSLKEIDLQAGRIRRIRGKSGVYGEWKLWQPTIDAIKRAMERRPVSSSDLLVLSKRGESLIAPTRTGNKSSRIPNLWAHLLKTVGRKYEGFPRLPFKCIRKTAANFVRQEGDGELAGVFLCHGQPVKSDMLSEVYSNRPFGKLDALLARLEKKLNKIWS